MRRAAKVDANQKEIVGFIRQIGGTVTPTHQIGKGFPDIVVGFRGVNYLMEIKDGEKVPSKRKLTPDEVDWHDRWGGQVSIVESCEDVLTVLGLAA